MMIEPCKASLYNFVLKGININSYVSELRVYENICKPYLTAEAILIDNNNLIENLGVKGGDPIYFDFYAEPNNRHYATTLQILSITGRQNPGNIKSIIYTFNLIGGIYIQDRKSLVQKGSMGETGTQAIQNIFNQYLTADRLTIAEQSQGAIGDKEGYTTSNMKPLAAIDEIRRHLIFQGRTGNSLFFRDRTNVKLGSLEYFYNKRSSQQYFIQKETWGDEFGDRLLYNSVIVGHIEAGRYNMGIGGDAEAAAMGVQGQIVADIHEGLINKYISGGASPNVQLTNSFRMADATAAFQKTIGEQKTSAKFRNGYQLLLKVPLQTGIDVTVGNGITVTLCPPAGDDYNSNPYNYYLSGLWFVCDVTHEIATDSRMMNGTTVLQCLLVTD